MIIQALNQLYDRYTHDPEIEIPRDGFSIQPIGFEIILEQDGTLHAIQSVLVDKKPKRQMVLGDTKPSGAGINPCFLWDNPVYLLSIKEDDPKPERTLECFKTFRDRHNQVRNEINSPDFDAVCAFLNSWNADADEIAKLPQQIQDSLKVPLAGNGIFRIRNELILVHQSPRVVQWWSSRSDKKKWWEPAKPKVATLGQCAITGESDVPIARLHEPKIKGVLGTNMSGASLVSFNETAYNSYGLEQSRNASVSEPVAFGYCNALNRLLSREARQKIQLGDTTLVFWSEKPTLMEHSLSSLMNLSDASDDEDDDEPTEDAPANSGNNVNLKGESGPAEKATKLDSIRTTLEKLVAGQYADELGDPDTPFYLLGLSPNSGRISVRSWTVESLGQLVDNLRDHYRDISIYSSLPLKNHGFPSVRDILRETVRDSKDIPNLLVGPLLRSVVEGSLYPEALFAAMIRRIRADREINATRAGFLKAALNRKSRFFQSSFQKEISMSLDPERPEPAYQMGRLFAALERNQIDALGLKINATIKDRYFGAASATPGSVFPRLIRLSQHHLSNLEGGHRIVAEKRIQEIMSHLSQFPPHLSLAEQGLFAIGYYHQVQDFFTKKNAIASDPESIVM